MSISTTEKLANPGPLGLCGFALTTWLLSLINGGFYTANNVSLVIAMAFAFGGTAQAIAGILEFKKGNTFGFTAFISYGAFWWSWALFVRFFNDGADATFIAWYLAIWGTFTLMMFIASLSKPKALQAIFFFLTLTFYALALGDATAIHTISRLGGILGLITALLAFYLAAAEMINECYGRSILPIGEKK
ncbi:transcriptional regulator [Mergibacter septicus]|uniref:Transcriptional regulator n=1 Tax=Mergibacter septicus TaxID=221402 RepID=A0A8E3MFT6_9PAST|nr:acetate uptake transporter [Mergibacter septicus]AWX15289.1 transcriptional regulator [Mergibacter septicus]QDJ14543.1 transcriptional regulator [Mergibacter septicus]UTU48021.1 acetate uptake transporter [Mergibacter septicus]WMR96370.1 acetate uptake transporter [Mergibacter septicus]